MSDAEDKSKENSEICSTAFNLQRILTIPKAEIGPLYYMSKLCV